MSSGMAILFSHEDRPRVLDLETLTKMQEAANAKPGSTWCLMGSPDDIQVAHYGAILLVSVGDLSLSPRENERRHYKALTIGHICISHNNFITDIPMTGLLMRGLDTVTELACRNYAMHICDHFTEEQARALAAETFQTAALLIDCTCVASNLAAVTGIGFHLDTVPHKPGLLN